MSSKTKTTATTEDGKPALVPKLRFPEFRDSEGWEEVDFAEAIFFQEGPGIMAVDFRDEGVPLVRLSGLAGQSISLEGCNYLDPNKVEQKWSHFRLEAGDIVVSCSASFGRPATVTDVAAGAVFYTGLVRFKAKDGLICVSYLEVFLGSPLFLQQAESFAVGGGIKHFGPSHLRQMKVPLPRIPEQQKIAECLSSVAELIAAQARKVDALKTHKKGLMQQLFPREGETQPRLRFPEFQNAGEWSKMTLGQAATFYNGRAYKQEELLESGIYPVLRVGNFFTNKNWYYSDLELDETKYCDYGDLLYAWSASFGPRVWLGGKVIYHYHIWKVEEHSGIDRHFLFITLENETERMKAKSANGLGLLHITKGTIEGWESSFPPQPEEQQRIASCLSSLDALITAESQKHEALKTHKKGLMQQLFPIPEGG